MALATRSYSDLDLNFTAHPVTGDISKRKDVYAVTGSLRNLLSTNHYERLFQPQIGSNVRRLLFEPIDVTTATMLQDHVKQTIDNFEPRVKLINVSVVPNYTEQGYTVGITFFMQNRAEPITINLFLERVR